MRSFIIKTLFATIFTFHTLWSGSAFAYPPKAQLVADRIAGLLAPFESLVAKVSGDSVYITIPGKGAIVSAGALGMIYDDGGEKIGYVRVSSVYDKYAVCEVLVSSGEIVPGRSRVRGLLAPGRVLWIASTQLDEERAPILDWIEEAARDRGSLEIIPRGSKNYLLEKTKIDADKLSPVDIAKLSAESGADIAIVADVSIQKEEGGYEAELTVYSPEGKRLLDMSEAWRTAPGVKSAKKDDTSPDTEAKSIIDDENKVAGTLQKKWGGTVAQAAEKQGSVMNILDRVRWKKYKFKGSVSAVAIIKNAAGERLLAILVKDKVHIMKEEGDKLSPVVEIASPGSRPVSLAVHDNGAKQDIFVNAFQNEGLESYLIGETDGKYSIVKDKLLFYFSAASDGSLLAQKAAEGPRIIGPEVYTVSWTKKELNFVPSIKLQGKDVPLGINRTDIDGDGIPDLAGISSAGHLLIFTQSGALAWKGAGFGQTNRSISVAGEKGSKTRYIPPMPLSMKDKKIGAVLAIGGAEYRSGGPLSSASLDSGWIKFINIREKEYVIQDMVMSEDGWISDLIDLSRAGGRNDAVGYIRVLPGYVGEDSEIAIPVE